MGVPDGVALTGRSPRTHSPRRGRRRPEGRTRTPSQRTLDQFTRRVTQGLADIEYFLRQPLGWRDGTAVVWAGMRGAVNESERTKIVELMRTSADTVPGPDPRTVDRSKEGFTASVAHTLAVLAAQREALLDARDNGLFDADVLADALTDLNASEIAIELRSRHVD